MNAGARQPPRKLQGVRSYFDEEGRRVWDGASLRIVHAQRARKLRRRGEEVTDSGERTRTGRAVFMWFVDDLDTPPLVEGTP